MLIDANECPLCGGRKADADFCEACTAEIEAAGKRWDGVLPPLASVCRAAKALEIMRRNGRERVVWDRAKAQAEKRQARLLREQPDEVPHEAEHTD